MFAIVCSQCTFSQRHRPIIVPYTGLIPFDYDILGIATTHNQEEGAHFLGSPLSFGLKLRSNGDNKRDFHVDINYSVVGYRFIAYDNYLVDNSGQTVKVDTVDWKTTIRKTRIMLGYSKNFEKAKVRSFFDYFTCSIGYKHTNKVRVKNNILQPKPEKLNVSIYDILYNSVAMRIALGKRWIINDQTNLMLEIGAGGGGVPVQFGVEFNL